MISDVTSLEGAVEKIDEKLTLLIPLAAGGDQFVECCRGISEIEGDGLRITIPEWLSGMLSIKEGTLVCVQNENGQFNIYPVHALPIH
jgi:hypothetical protein